MPCVKTWRLLQVPEEPSVSAIMSPVTFGTGPHWSNETKSLYYVSVFGKTLMRYAEGSHFKAKLDYKPSFIIPIEGKKDRFAVGLDKKVVEIEWDGGVKKAKVVRTIAEVHKKHSDERFTHAKADPRGRLFAARSNKQSGCLYRFSEDGRAHKVLDHVEVCKGFCWDLGRKAFYLGHNYTITRYDYDVDTGNISNPQIVFAMQDQEYIVDDAKLKDQDDPQYELFTEGLDPNNPYDPQSSTPSHSPDDKKNNSAAARQGNTDDYDEGKPEFIPQDDRHIGLLDDNDYDALYGTDADDSADDASQFRRQGELQDLPKGGRKSASQIYELSSQQDYDESGTGSDDSDGSQDELYIPQLASHSYASGGPQGYASGNNDYDDGSGTETDNKSGTDNDTEAALNSFILRNGKATYQDYYSKEEQQDTPQDQDPGGPVDNDPADPRGFAVERLFNNTADYLEYARFIPPDAGGPITYGPGVLPPGARQGNGPSGGSYKKKLTGTLDGMTIDTEGNLWVANYNGSQVLKIDPKKGKLLLVIPVGVQLVTSVTFGGAGLDVLYVTSAATDREGKKVQASPAGATFDIKHTGVKGHPNYNVRLKQCKPRAEDEVDEIKDLT
ncbi:hypothetical protein PYW08_003478 [Mythimna loreyi]|uniref:Uncharacterized protein n=1 Tax=Mythimna loreyi TaxID=667449 RepID=A0ACC2QTH9_9NEOP|nr:hypothetical protein PYW08_003478 [Mythimna loreyi]